MVKDIITDTELLSQPCEAATAEDAQVAQDLLDTMASRPTCACLAANQIGVAKRIIVYKEEGKQGDRAIVMFNPRITAAMRPYKIAESCLSIEEEHVVKRFYTIRVAYDALVDGKLVAHTRKLDDWNAEMVLHAIDHCNGVLV